MKTSDLMFSEKDLKIEYAKDFIVEVSKGNLSIPDVKIVEFVKSGLCYIKSCRDQICCVKQLVSILNVMNFYFDFGVFPHCFFRRLANVLRSRFYKLEKNQRTNTALY